MFSRLWSESVRVLLSYGPLGLLLVGFTEAWFFPVPPDVVLIALALNAPRLAFWYALAATAASVLGGVFGYFLGSRAGRPILDRFVPAKTVDQMDRLFARYGGWAVAIAGFTPIPYKVFTVGSGVFRIDMVVFVLASILGRGARFFIEAIVIFSFGQGAGAFLSRYLELTTIGAAVAAILFYLLMQNTRWLGKIKELWNKALFVFRARGVLRFGTFANYAAIGAMFALGFMVFFAWLTDEVLENEMASFDQRVILAVRSFTSPGLTAFMRFLSLIGSPGILMGLAILVTLSLAWRRASAWRIALPPVDLLGVWLLNEGLKRVFHRARPTATRLVAASGYSFPSGHAMVAFAFFGLLAYLLWRRLRPGIGRVMVILLAGLLVLGIGVSRIYLGVHYPTDIVAGYAAGAFWLIGCTLGIEAVERVYGSRKA